MAGVETEEEGAVLEALGFSVSLGFLTGKVNFTYLYQPRLVICFSRLEHDRRSSNCNESARKHHFCNVCLGRGESKRGVDSKTSTNTQMLF